MASNVDVVAVSPELSGESGGQWVHRGEAGRQGGREAGR